jgi:transcriptional regulator with XRE-family HTH domain
MNDESSNFISFLKDLMRRRKRLPSQLAKDLGMSHATVSRWLAGMDIPNPRSCLKLADYSDVPVERILAMVNSLPTLPKLPISEWPEFREYAYHKYPDELDEDLITIIEDLIERRRTRKHGNKDSEMGK